MAVYVVMEPPGEAGQAERARLIRDGFAWLAFLVPPLWLLWHRLWIEALLAFVALGLLSALGEMAGFGLAGWSLMLLVSVYVGLEGQALRVNALRRRGWRDWGVVSAERFDDAEARYAYGGEEEIVDRPAPSQVIVPDASRARPAQTGLALGLAHTPGRL